MKFHPVENGVQIDVDHAAPVIDRDVGQGTEQAADAGIVDGIVQRAEFLKQGRDDVFLSVDTGDISGIGESGSAALANTAVDVDDHHRGTQSGQFDRGGCAHTAGRAGDQRHFVLEALITGHFQRRGARIQTVHRLPFRLDVECTNQLD